VNHQWLFCHWEYENTNCFGFTYLSDPVACLHRKKTAIIGIMVTPGLSKTALGGWIKIGSRTGEPVRH
jgi:hypothetical protein